MAQDNKEKTFAERFPKKILDRDDSFFTITIENDLFGQGSDEHYTNGARFTHFDMGAEDSFIGSALGTLIPSFQLRDSTAIYYSLGQNLYTPENLLARTPDPEDRPYAGFLYGSAGFTTISENHIDDVELTLGIVGPAALGESTQKFVHKITNSDDPKGWGHQLDNEPALILSYQRRWPEFYAAEFDFLRLRTSPNVTASIGNVYTYAGSGISFQLIPKEFEWQSQPLRVRPSMPGSGFFAVPENRFAWSLFAGIEGRAIGRNIFLDGNTFEGSPSVNKKHFVADANAGISATYGHTQVSYTLNWRSEEFEGQDEPSLFGAISVGYRF